jgi:anti-sigma regulatory factor (Ser/Thr protein kinase)
VQGGCPSHLCAELKLSKEANALPLVRVGHPAALALEVEPDAFVPRSRLQADLARALERACLAREEATREGAVSDVRWRVPSDFDALEEFQDQLSRWLEATGLSAAQRHRTALAVRELTANAIEWGHCRQRERLVSISARLDREKVTVNVRDSGPGFNPRNLPHAARPGDPLSHLTVRADKQLREGGFGILMASGLVDFLTYNEAGNEALAVKYLPQRHVLAS